MFTIYTKNWKTLIIKDSSEKPSRWKQSPISSSHIARARASKTNFRGSESSVALMKLAADSARDIIDFTWHYDLHLVRLHCIYNDRSSEVSLRGSFHSFVPRKSSKWARALIIKVDRSFKLAGLLLHRVGFLKSSPSVNFLLRLSLLLYIEWYCAMLTFIRRVSL